VRHVETPDGLDAALAGARAAGQRIALVPTMGFLHEGHLSLVDRARASADAVVVSVFVNPLQFGPSEDLARYPRDLERDASLLAARGVAVLFAPGEAVMYPDGPPAVQVAAHGLEDRLCGAFRPGHFRGVLTVVAKLFHLVRPQIGVFGQKDFQQLVLIRRMVKDLDFPVRIVSGPIVRDADGLALSSRNVYLSPARRAQALRLSQGLRAAQRRHAEGEDDAAVLIATARDVIEAGDGVRLQYLELVEPEGLAPLDRAQDGAVLAVAAHVGSTRLIDNVVLERGR
jgi:pantoate--beta-alanine ligase